MKKVLVFLICFLFTQGIFAAEIERASITYKGTQGIFFSEAVATKILIDLEEFNAQDRRIKLLDTKIELMDEKILLLEEGIVLSDRIGSGFEKNFNLEHKLRIDEQKRYEEELSRKEAWYRSPGFFFGLGFVVAGALAVGLSFSLQSTRN